MVRGTSGNVLKNYSFGAYSDLECTMYYDKYLKCDLSDQRD